MKPVTGTITVKGSNLEETRRETLRILGETVVRYEIVRQHANVRVLNAGFTYSGGVGEVDLTTEWVEA